MRAGPLPAGGIAFARFGCGGGAGVFTGSIRRNGRRRGRSDEMMETVGYGTGKVGRRRRWILGTVWMFGLGLIGTARGLAAGDGGSKTDPGYREVPALNAGLAPAAFPRLDTPQSVFEVLTEAARSGDGDRGARCLNLNAI